MKVLILGAGRSATFLINTLAKGSLQYGWELSVAERSEELLYKKIENYPHVKGIILDITKTQESKSIIQKQGIVVSLLPPALHFQIALICLELGKHLLTASYLSKDLEKLSEEVKKKDLLFLTETGADPGLDHISAMSLIHKIQAEGGKITGFQSLAGGLLQLNSLDKNPWHYKFTWNPQNVVRAGQDTLAQYIENGKVKYISYSQLFEQVSPLEIEGLGSFEYYVNRNNLIYRNLYNLKDTNYFLRGTIRPKGFSQAWSAFVKLGLTSNKFQIEIPEGFSNRNFVELFIKNSKEKSLKELFAQFTNLELHSEAMEKISYTDIFEANVIKGIKKGSPAEILQNILEKKWQMNQKDKDLILMQHKITYDLSNKSQEACSELILRGENSLNTAMTKAVGLPLALATKHLILGNITSRGVQRPILPDIYKPVLKELKSFSVEFKEKDITFVKFLK